jgi:hypothetical protein
VSSEQCHHEGKDEQSRHKSVGKGVVVVSHHQKTNFIANQTAAYSEDYRGDAICVFIAVVYSKPSADRK